MRQWTQEDLVNYVIVFDTNCVNVSIELLQDLKKYDIIKWQIERGFWYSFSKKTFSGLLNL